MENDNDTIEKAQTFRDRNFMLLGAAMASQIIGDTVKCLEADPNDEGRIIGWIDRRFDPDSPFFFEMRPNFMSDGIWSMKWDFMISDAYGKRAQITNASLDKRAAAWIKATISLL